MKTYKIRLFKKKLAAFHCLNNYFKQFRAPAYWPQ